MIIFFFNFSHGYLYAAFQETCQRVIISADRYKGVS